MKKRFALTVCVLLMALLCACVFAACDGTPSGKEASFTVSYDLGAYQGEGNAPASVDKEKDGKLNLHAADQLPVWEGHTFEGWKLNGEGDLLAGGAEITVSADAKYVAQWKIAAREYEKGSIYEVVPEEELKHIIGYIYTMGKREGYEASLSLPYCQTGTEDPSGVDLLGYISLGCSVGDDETGGMVYFFDSEEHAKANRDFWVNAEPVAYEKEMKVVGNRIYYGYPSGEEWYEYYVNTILASEIPQLLSETRLNFMLDSVTHGEYASTLTINVSTNYKAPYDHDATAESGESFLYWLDASGEFERANIFAYCTAREANDPTNENFGGLESDINQYGENGSCVDKKREDGFVFFRYIEEEA